jgi:iron complex outermembrane receptor protein
MRHPTFVLASLCAGVSILALAASQSAAEAAGDIGSVNIDTAHDTTPRRAAHPARSTGPSRPARAPVVVAPVVAAPAGPPISSDAAIGSKAPVGSAPALAVTQQSLNAVQPGSIISDKIIRDVVIPSGDYNETAKFTPNFVSNNVNGALGDSKSSWRGFQDGQFNITFDGIPFGDANDPTHHSAAYFPSAFLGKVIIDRGPGQASQVGYAAFGGTMGLHSLDLSDTFGGNIQTSFGSWNTSMESVTLQSGYNKDYQTRALFQFEHAFTDGSLDWGHYNQINFLAKLEKQFGDVTVTAFSTYGTENYNNVTAPTWLQWRTLGKSYGAVNNNPATQQYYGWNNSEKRTDMEYFDLRAEEFGFKIDNKFYTYAYDYPNYQNNGTNQGTEGPQSNSLITKATAATANSTACAIGQYKTKYVTAAGVTKNICISGIGASDVIGYLKFNNYRAYGDILNVKRDIGQDWYSGQLRFGLWYEHTENSRYQAYTDYTTGMTFQQLGAGLGQYKVNLESDFNNVQPFVEYEWKPTERLSITPGYKFESFTRMHDAVVNNTSLAPLDYSHTYTGNLPFFNVRYRLDDNWSVYGQASKGFLVPSVSAYYVLNPAAENIQAQQTTNYQIGAVYKSADITADVDVFQIRSNNFPILTNFTTGPNAGSQLYVNGGTAQYRGLETQGTWAFGRKIGLEGLAATGALGLLDAHYTQGQFTGLQVGDAPHFTLAGGLVYDDSTFFGSLLQKVTGAQFGQNGEKGWDPLINGVATPNNNNLNRIPAYTTTDIVLGYRYKLAEGFAYGYGKSIEFKVGMQNVFDHRSVTEISGDPSTGSSITANKAVTGQSLQQGDTGLTYSFQSGRYIYGAVKYSF